MSAINLSVGSLLITIILKYGPPPWLVVKQGNEGSSASPLSQLWRTALHEFWGNVDYKIVLL